ncbi:MAG TPA: bacteriohemerythrin [Bryobacteraceae bacterium]|nr:bacteriohemerythrin [Bryobacteraceae bacterium]
MSIFEWKPEYSLGHPEIDAQPKKLFELADRLHGAMAHGKAKEAMSKTLADLIAYTKLHFCNEERLMQSHHYPEYGQHKALHDDLTARVVEFQKSFESGHAALSIDLLHFLKDWLQHHIGETDRKVAAFLKSKAA